MTSRFLLSLALLVGCSLTNAQPRTKNVVLITLDGVRWQDLFGGIDSRLMNEKEAGMDKAAALREKLWSTDARQRRERLMPFFWGKLAPRGVVLGNPDRGSSVKVTNAFRVSYPGYAEILTGRAQDAAIRGNNQIQNPTETVLEFLRRKLKLERSQVALFGSWETFRWIGESRPGSIFINAGFQAAEGREVTPRIAELSRIQFELLTPWDGARHDHVSFEMALEYLKTAQPRVLYVALDETDDWAHAKRYDRVLETLQLTDRWLEKLWNTLESMPAYRGVTTVVITTDHGRGDTLADFHGHGARVAGADRIWAAMAGPDTPALGEAANTEEYFQRDIAPTMLDLLGIDYKEYSGVAGRPIRPRK